MDKFIISTKKYYDKHAELWTKRKTDSFHHEEQFHKLIKLWPEKGTILDIGCAAGILAPLFLGIGRKLKYFGIDISNSFLKIARRRYPQLTFLQANIAEESSLPRKKFDGFLAAAVLMHVPLEHWEKMFKNIEKTLKPKSYGYITLPTEHPSKGPDDTDSRHFTLLGADEQVNTLKKLGLKIHSKGIIDGTTKHQVWRWYIVQLP